MDLCNHSVSLEQIVYVSKRKRVFLKCRILPKNLDNKGVNTRWLANMTKKGTKKLTCIYSWSKLKWCPQVRRNSSALLPPRLKHLKCFNTITIESLHILVQNWPEDEGSKKIWKLCTNKPKFWKSTLSISPAVRPRNLAIITNTRVEFYLYSCRWLPISGKENTLIFI